MSYRVSKYSILESTAKIAYLGRFSRSIRVLTATYTRIAQRLSPLTCSVWCLLLAEISRATVFESTKNGQFRVIRVPFPLEYEFHSATLSFLHLLFCFSRFFRDFCVRTLWLSVRSRAKRLKMFRLSRSNGENVYWVNQKCWFKWIWTRKGHTFNIIERIGLLDFLFHTSFVVTILVLKIKFPVKEMRWE